MAYVPQKYLIYVSNDVLVQYRVSIFLHAILSRIYQSNHSAYSNIIIRNKTLFIVVTRGRLLKNIAINL